LIYAALILFLTFDPWSAMAGFLMLGIPIAGFLLFGRGWWKGLLLVSATVLLTLVLAPQPHIAFGLIFLCIEIGLILWKVLLTKSPASRSKLETGGGHPDI
jgi:ABC-type molybdate transport system permease subunit